MFHTGDVDVSVGGATDILGSVIGSKEGDVTPARRTRSPPQHRRDDARLILTQDPDLTSKRGQALQILLHLFEIEEATLYLKAG